MQRIEGILRVIAQDSLSPGRVQPAEDSVAKLRAQLGELQQSEAALEGQASPYLLLLCMQDSPGATYRCVCLWHCSELHHFPGVCDGNTVESGMSQALPCFECCMTAVAVVTQSVDAFWERAATFTIWCHTDCMWNHIHVTAISIMAAVHACTIHALPETEAHA